jgi:hypothetical protein
MAVVHATGYTANDEAPTTYKADKHFIQDDTITLRMLAPDVEAQLGGTAGLPAGLIAMWGGLVANIPTGWFLCDGQNGTPDLRDKFVKGANGNPGGTGGSATHSHTTTQPADHAALSHVGATVGNHAFTQPGAHSDHAALSHSAHLACAVANHAFTQPSAHGTISSHSGTSVGTSGAGSAHTHTQGAVTQPSAHADVLNHTHNQSNGLGATGNFSQVIGTIDTSAGGTGGTPTTTALGQPTGNPISGGVASQAHTGTSVANPANESAHTHAAGAVTQSSDHSALTNNHAGGAVDAHAVTQASAHSDHAALAHSAHSGGAVDAHTVGQANQHAVQSHSGAAVNTVNSEPAYYALCFIQKS